ncbi:MAG TPA: molybdopterin molybdotransferase MoeA [Sphingomicrobium sp.]|nr:molybdopterin molybdotransferase MoeA [Sphingomicrobium sp.]
MISFDEAIDIIARTARPLGSETVPVEQAGGRVLSRPVVAQIAAPRWDVSAMDGYALRSADLSALPARLNVVGESFAGAGSRIEVATGQCVRIFTGAAIPGGADRVVIQEEVGREGDVAIVGAWPGEATHIRRRGGDFREGDELLARGRLLDPRAIVAAAAADVPAVDVYRQPTLQILGTGDELAEPGTAAKREDAIPDSVSLGVAALARQWGARLTARLRLADELQSLVEAAGEAVRSADVVVVTGGASVGERDFAKAMFEPAGLELAFSKVAIKPGKPVWLGRAGDALVMGLPGNPTSAMVTGRLLLAPLLAAMTGRGVSEALQWRSAPLASNLDSSGAREAFHRGCWAGDQVRLFSNQDSSAQKLLAEADLLVRQPPGAAAQAAGSNVDVLDF